MTSSLKRFSLKSKGKMHQVVQSWKGTGLSVEILKEGLRLLSKPKRERASALVADEYCHASRFVCMYGKGRAPKLALQKNHARILLELVKNVLDISKTEAEAVKRVEIASSVLLSRQKPPFALSDRKWQPLLEVMSSFDPTVNQLALF
jgi:hypothetical protein